MMDIHYKIGSKIKYKDNFYKISIKNPSNPKSAEDGVDLNQSRLNIAKSES